MKLFFESIYYLPDEIDLLINIHLIVITISIFLIFYFKKKILENIEMFIFILVMAIVYYGLLQLTIINPSALIHNNLKNGTYKIVEGEVTNLKPMPKSGHIREEFSVKNIHFSTLSLEENKNTMFFNMTKYYGSPIQKNGQKVKIYYLESKPEKFCFPLLPKCIEFGDETVNKIIKLWVENQEN